MYNIQVLNTIAPAGLDVLPKNFFHCDSAPADPSGILLRSHPLSTQKIPASVLAISRAGVGVNHIPVTECTQRGIVVFNTPGANANAVKELTILSLLLASRDIHGALRWLDSLSPAEKKDIKTISENKKSTFSGPELAGKKLGVIGLGAIGVLVANAAVLLGMEVLGYDPYLSINNAWSLSGSVVHTTNLNELLQQCDYITLHLPATSETVNMLDKSRFSQMKDGVRILNLARGELVNNSDLLQALSAKKVARYLSDFCAPELLSHPQITFLPHLGASTPESEEKCAVMAAEELRDYLLHGNIVNSVNFPSVSHTRTSGTSRICLIHKNVPNMLSKISSAVGTSGLNIGNLLNSSQGEYAYTLVDVEGDANLTKPSLGKIEQVVRMRILPPRSL